MNLLARRLLVLVVLCFSLHCFAQAGGHTQRATQPASPDDLHRWLKALSEWDHIKGDPYMSPVSGEILLHVLPELHIAGPAAFAIAPGVAELLATTSRNWTTLAQVLIEMTPPPPKEDVPPALQAARGNNAPSRVLALARLAHSTQPEAIGALRDATRAYGDMAQRVTGTLALGYAGDVLPEIAAIALAVNLRDRERVVRAAAADSLGRMCTTLQTRVPATPAKIVAGFATEFLKTRDNPQGAVIILRCLPLQVAAQAKGSLQALVDDPAVANFNKLGAIVLLGQLQAAEQASAGKTDVPIPPGNGI